MGEEKGQGVGRVGYDAPALLTQRSHGSARHHLMGQNMPKNATNRPNSLRRPTFLETDGSHTQVRCRQSKRNDQAGTSETMLPPD